MSEAFMTHHAPNGANAMHRHVRPYLALVLEGTYEERSVDGRYRLVPGALVYHPSRHAHTNTFLDDQVRVLNIELDEGLWDVDQYSVAQVDQEDDFGDLMCSQPVDALAAARERLCTQSNTREPVPDWLSSLAEMLGGDTEPTSIKTLSKHLGISPEHASRCFTREFGQGPSSFRREQQLRRALGALGAGQPLASAAAHAGFADQSHMGRVFKSALGTTPGAIRQ